MLWFYYLISQLNPPNVELDKLSMKQNVLKTMFYPILTFRIHDKYMSYVMVNVYHQHWIMHMNNLIEINMKMLMMVDYEQEKTIEQESQIRLIVELLMMI